MTRSCVIWKPALAICANWKTVVRRSSNPSLKQGKLTDALEKAITSTLSKTELEDLYLPYKPKRRTRGQIAIEAGLEPLADLLWNEPAHDPEAEAAKYINADNGIADSKAALDGARYILMERFAEDAALLAKVRDYLWKNAHLVSTVVSGKEEEGAKFRDLLRSP
ncbi:transcription accessory protein [Klebsiella variicola]|uniref:Transcription accessory protein n=1 Tax=Klebsiella variicola TaxID=244366 RepID=A0A7H4M8X3_KLEVA|nr:transcription accessory protein [Klebsiella variicola]